MNITCKKCGLISDWEPRYMKYLIKDDGWNPVILDNLSNVPDKFKKKYKDCSCLVSYDIRKLRAICPGCKSEITHEYVFRSHVLIYHEPDTKEPVDIDELVDRRNEIYEDNQVTLYVHDNCL